MNWQYLTIGIAFCSLTALFASANAAEPVPPPLAAATKVRVVVNICKPGAKNESRTLELENQLRITELADEIGKVRANSTGIWAAKYSCSTDVSFFQGARLITSIHMFPCSSLEDAPVSGKRYFTYKTGLNHLPALTRTVGITSRGKECK